MNQQIYEEYRKLTNAFTDYNGENFISTLRVSINFIDQHKGELYSKKNILHYKVYYNVSLDEIIRLI